MEGERVFGTVIGREIALIGALRFIFCPYTSCLHAGRARPEI